MKILFIGDCHFNCYTAFATIDPVTGINTRLLAALHILDEIAGIRDQHKVDLTICLGDIFHLKQKIDAQTIALVVEKFHELWSDPKSIYFLVGNHDCFGGSALETVLKAFKPVGTVIDRPRVIPLGDVKWYAWPYTSDLDTLKRQMAEAKYADLVTFHQGLNEAVVGAYHISIPSALSLKDLPKAKFTICGHYHLPQLVQDDPPVMYAGSIFQVDLSERQEHKRVVILDTQTWDWTSIPIQSGPTFHLYKSVDEARGGKHKECDFIKIVCRKAEAEEAKKEFPKAQVEVIKELVVERRVIPESASTSDASLLSSYMAEKKPELDPDKLLKIGMELLDE